jgi:hypothetical protein
MSKPSFFETNKKNIAIVVGVAAAATAFYYFFGKKPEKKVANADHHALPGSKADRVKVGKGSHETTTIIIDGAEELLHNNQSNHHHSLPGSRDDNAELKVGKGTHMTTALETLGVESLLHESSKVGKHCTTRFGKGVCTAGLKFSTPYSFLSYFLRPDRRTRRRLLCHSPRFRRV